MKLTQVFNFLGIWPILIIFASDISAQNKKLPICIKVNAGIEGDSINLIVKDHLIKNGFKVITNKELEQLTQKRTEQILSRAYKDKITDQDQIYKMMTSGPSIAYRLIINAFITEDIGKKVMIDSLNYVIFPVYGKDYSKAPVVNRVDNNLISKETFSESILTVAELIIKNKW